MAFCEDGGGPYTPPELPKVQFPNPPASEWPDRRELLGERLDAFLRGGLSLAPQFIYSAEISALLPSGSPAGVENVEYPNEKIPLKSDGIHCFGCHHFMCAGRPYEVAVIIEIASGEAVWRWLRNEPDASTRRIICSAAHRRRRA